METKKLESFKCFEEINLGFIIGGDQNSESKNECGADADRFCASWCPTAGCKHDGCCGSNFDWGGEPSLH
ncbi:MAG: hypothetical protein RBR35_16150 [Salinivirgaceae bacterium]|nr:hypothetical protein [Salinivirgaceae bacterium]